MSPALTQRLPTHSPRRKPSPLAHPATQMPVHEHTHPAIANMYSTRRTQTSLTHMPKGCPATFARDQASTPGKAWLKHTPAPSSGSPTTGSLWGVSQSLLLLGTTPQQAAGLRHTLQAAHTLWDLQTWGFAPVLVGKCGLEKAVKSPLPPQCQGLCTLCPG